MILHFKVTYWLQHWVNDIIIYLSQY